MTLISRDELARTELHSEKVRAPARFCAWCGRWNGRHLYVYNTIHDSGRVEHGSRHFCSLGCYRSYNK